MRRDRRERPRRGGCERDNGSAEGDVPRRNRMRCRGAGLINRETAVRPGARSAGPSKAEAERWRRARGARSAPP